MGSKRRAVLKVKHLLNWISSECSGACNSGLDRLRAIGVEQPLSEWWYSPNVVAGDLEWLCDRLGGKPETLLHEAFFIDEYSDTKFDSIEELRTFRSLVAWRVVRDAFKAELGLL